MSNESVPSRVIALATIDSVPTPDEAKRVADGESGAVVGRDFAQPLVQADTTSHPLVRPLQHHVHRTRQVAEVSVLESEVDSAIGSGAAADSVGTMTVDSVLLAPAWIDWAWAANAIWIDDAGRVYDPAGRLLLDPSRLTEVAHSHQEAVLPSSVDARRRQSEVVVEVRNRLVDPVEGLMPIPGVEEVQPLEASDVARRSLALFLVATRAESMLSNRPLDPQLMQQRCPLGFSALSPAEVGFMSDRPSGTPANSPGAAAESLVWRYESLLTLQWALDMQFELPWPDEHADLTSVTRLMVDLPDQDIVDQARLRSTDQLLVAAELHHQLYFAVAAAQASGQDVPAGLDPGVICERLIALSWLLNLNAPGVGGIASSDVVPDSTEPRIVAETWDSTVAWVEDGMP
ncbi:DUF4272 domain-containing protein [Neorhodopirellula lusitana]|uniref:DUF4272 domain-containing protein n=1 Tax=Neorhodopirellula lusitana TaxID=445327 RepID=UPI0024B85AA6|nr:DUF4272 domain-containing protein [Neorhodopirellula lusitana]